MAEPLRDPGERCRVTKTRSSTSVSTMSKTPKAIIRTRTLTACLLGRRSATTTSRTTKKGAHLPDKLPSRETILERGRTGRIEEQQSRFHSRCTSSINQLKSLSALRTMKAGQRPTRRPTIARRTSGRTCCPRGCPSLISHPESKRYTSKRA